MKARVALALALVLVSAPALAGEPSIFEKAAAFEPTIHFAKIGAISIEPLLQTRWTATETSGANEATVVGFSVPRARIAVTTSLWDAVRFRLRVGSSSNGSATFQQAFGEIEVKHFRFRAGQLPLKLNAGEEPEAQGLSTADYSSFANAFAGGETQGLELAYDSPVRVRATLGNGARSGFSELLSPMVADIATTARVEVKAGAQHATDYESEASFRKTKKTTARFGVTGHFQEKGPTTTAPANNVEIASCDAGVRGSGFSLFASAAYLRVAPANVPAAESGGVMVFGSWFPARRVELFAQFDAIWPLGGHEPSPPGVANGQVGTTLFRTATFGSSFYVVPDVHRFLVQLDVQTMFDAEKTSLVPSNPALGVLASSSPQVAARVQLVLAL